MTDTDTPPDAKHAPGGEREGVGQERSPKCRVRTCGNHAVALTGFCVRCWLLIEVANPPVFYLNKETGEITSPPFVNPFPPELLRDPEEEARRLALSQEAWKDPHRTYNTEMEIRRQAYLLGVEPFAKRF